MDSPTTIQRKKLDAMPIELRSAQPPTHSKARGILLGVLIGVAIWTVALAVWIYFWHAIFSTGAK
jgi:hypothetical protein